MKSLFVISVLVFSLAGLASAEIIHGVNVRSDEVGSVVAGRYDFIEGLNVDSPYFDGAFYTAPCLSLTFVPGSTYMLERVEFIAGEVAGTATFEIRDDDGSGCASGPVLGTGSFEQVVEVDWQGSDLDQPLLVEEGRVYFINLMPVLDSQASLSFVGTPIPHCASENCEVWEGPMTVFSWMVKFYGTTVVATESNTWTTVKSLF